MKSNFLKNIYGLLFLSLTISTKELGEFMDKECITEGEFETKFFA